MRKLLWLATLCAAAIGALLGWRAGAFFARENLTVQLAARIALEDATGTTERTLESEAFRGTGRPAAELYAEAAADRAAIPDRQRAARRVLRPGFGNAVARPDPNPALAHLLH